jgi:hypothetical protein
VRQLWVSGVRFDGLIGVGYLGLVGVRGYDTMRILGRLSGDRISRL